MGWHGVSDPGLGGVMSFGSACWLVAAFKTFEREAECEWLCCGTGIDCIRAFGCGWFLCMAGFLPGALVLGGMIV